MKRLFLIALAFATLALGGCGFINTGEAGVRTQFSQIQPNVEQAGFYTKFLSHLDIFTVKETSVDVKNLTPRAKDNLTLRDLDVTIYYHANAAALPHFQATHSGQSAKIGDEDFERPGYLLVYKLASGVLNDSVSKFDSLTLHQNRKPLELAVKQGLQQALEADSPGTFEITNVVVTSIQTDPSIEQSIVDSIKAEKQVQTATQLVQVKQQEAKANEQLAQSLTPAFLQHEYNQALNSCAQRAGCTMIVGGNSTPIINLK
ncbi:SPFH domain-containing protein [Burkholderia gladioli]|uniref:SPFH domain-containing protein n=1 Tax=Burkholderia gladioli TaxID=28095 RepID=UPI003B5128A2